MQTLPHSEAPTERRVPGITAFVNLPLYSEGCTRPSRDRSRFTGSPPVHERLGCVQASAPARSACRLVKVHVPSRGGANPQRVELQGPGESACEILVATVICLSKRLALHPLQPATRESP